MERIKRRRRDVDAWRGVLERFASSGLAVPAFCEREAISEASFYRWRSILQGAAGTGKKRRAIPVVSGATKAAAEFVDLGALRSVSSRCELRVDLGGGVLLHLVRG